MSEIRAPWRYSFYPGCTLRSTAREFGLSTHAVCEALGIELIELEDWNCCGASSAHSASRTLGLALPARNLAKAQETGVDLAISCAGCYARCVEADSSLRGGGEESAMLQELLQFEYRGTVRPRSLLEIFVHDFDVSSLRTKVLRSLQGLRPVSYYGCVMVRPLEKRGWDDPEHPRSMDGLVQGLGAESVAWSYSTDCCGAGLGLSRRDIVVALTARLLDAAEEAGANCLVTACPLCHANLDTRQRDRARKMPVFYFTELMGLAFGLSGAAEWFRRHLVSPRPLLRRLGLAD